MENGDGTRNYFEPLPPDGTLCGEWRGVGYARQQYSNFIADRVLAESTSEFIAFVDSDTYFITAVHPEDLFTWDAGLERWIPRVIGVNGCCVTWQGATRKVTGRRLSESWTTDFFSEVCLRYTLV